MTQIGITANPSASDPAHHAVAVVPSDTADLPAASTFIYVGVSGNLKVTMLGDPRVDQHHGHQHCCRLALVPPLPWAEPAPRHVVTAVRGPLGFCRKSERRASSIADSPLPATPRAHDKSPR